MSLKRMKSKKGMDNEGFRVVTYTNITDALLKENVL